MSGQESVTKFCKVTAWLTAVLGFTLLLSPHAAAQNVPPAVISGFSTINSPGLAGYQAFLAVDACGNIYTIQNPNNNMNGGQVMETPAGGGTPQIVIFATGQPYYYVNLWIDPAKANLYVSEGANSLFQVPIKNCVLQTASEVPISIGNLGAVGYYWFTGGVATDAAGNFFIGNIIYCCGASYQLIEENPTQTVGTALLTNLVNPITSIAVDAANNIYYTDTSGKLFKLPYSGGAYASAPVPFGGSFNNAIGVTIDNAGNLYVTDAGAYTIYEIPYETSVLNPADKFVIVNLLSLHNQYYGTQATNLQIASPSVIDSAGNVYFTLSLAPNSGAAQSSLIAEVTRSNAFVGSTAVGVPTSATLNVFFNAAATPTAINFVSSSGVYSAGSSTAGSSCAAGTFYAINSTCTLNVNFTPAVPGLNSGTVILADASGATIASASLSGTGLGAGLTVDPGEGVAVGSGFKTPTGVAVDLFGNAFFADSGKNQVFEILPGNSVPVSIGTGFNAPTGVAADAGGNVYIADTGNNQIVKVPFINGALKSSAQSVIVSGTTSIAGSKLNAPSGLSLDAGGNLYIADTGNNRVVYLPQYGNWSVAGAFTLGTGFSKPLATTVSPSGVIYVADSGNGNIYSLPYAAAATPKTLVASGYTQVTALATDAAGDLFVVDTGKNLISRIPNIGGVLTPASAFNITGTIPNPYGVALNSAGNLYATDNVNAAAYLVSRTSAMQDFGKWNPNSTSSSLSFLLEDSGNQPLVFGSPFDTRTGNTTNFTPVTPSSSPCTNGVTVAVGANCVVTSTFTPATLATYSETLTFSSNAKNAAPTQATFTGTGATVLATTTTLAVTSPTGNPYYTQPIVLTANVTASTGTPSGSVALLVDGLKTTTAALSNGTATFTLPTGLTGGTHTLQVNYLGGTVGSINYSQSQSPVSNITVTRVATTLAVSAATDFINPASEAGGNGVILTAIVSSAVNANPSGMVTFVISDPAASGPQSVTVPLAFAASGVLEAVYTYTTIAPPSGTISDLVSITASYSGDGNFIASATTAPTTFYVSPSTGSVGISASSYTITASAAGSTSITFTANSYGGWNGYSGFRCVGLPANTICVLLPGQLQVQPSTSTASTSYPTATTQLSVLINNPPNSPPQSSMLGWISAGFGMVFFFARRRLVRSRSWGTSIAVLACFLCLGAVEGLTGCGSGSSYLTPKGTSTFTVVVDSDLNGGACPVNQVTGQPNLNQYPCAEQTFSINLVVQ